MTDLPGAAYHSAAGRDVPWATPDARTLEAVGQPHDATGRHTRANGAAGGNGGGRHPGPSTPGSVPLRPLDLGDILDGTFATIRRNPRATLGLSAVLVTVQELLSLGAQTLTGDLPSASFGEDDGALVFGGGLGTVIGLLISAVVGAVLTGMIVVVVSEDVLGRRTTAAQVWRRIRPRVWALLCAAVIAGALPYAGLALLVAPGILLWGGWALTTPALVLEGLGPIRAVRRSWRLAWPSFGRVWGIRVLSVVLGYVMQLLIAVPFALVATLAAEVAHADPEGQIPVYALAIITVGAIVAGTLVEPFYAGVLALLYVDRRMRAEGLDIVIQLGNRALPGQGSPTRGRTGGSTSRGGAP